MRIWLVSTTLLLQCAAIALTSAEGWPSVDGSDAVSRTPPAPSLPAPDTASRFVSRLWSEDTSIAPWAADAVLNLAAEGLFNGYPDGTFRGTRGVTRLDATIAIFRGLGLLSHSPASSTVSPDEEIEFALRQFAPVTLAFTSVAGPFADLTGDWSIDGVNDLAAEGILRGYADSTFRQRTRLTRAEFAVIVARLLLSRRIDPRPRLHLDQPFFGDVTGNEWWFGAMLVATETGVMKGYGDHTFRGGQALTRNELAVALARLADMAGLWRAQRR